ncbi:hypothetical protein PIROE2DRAFT_16087 [Piromyces sp. E2]|nr:hypothetical protein PIROE2DRAFT_16087 [Piromyces sp. E2]|eukprot:OUM58585.1 hypothetical protein PIROE2DRAFT_16087 [Piromyces sp. E2]
MNSVDVIETVTQYDNSFIKLYFYLEKDDKYKNIDYLLSHKDKEDEVKQYPDKTIIIYVYVVALDKEDLPMLSYLHHNYIQNTKGMTDTENNEPKNKKGVNVPKVNDILLNMCQRGLLNRERVKKIIRVTNQHINIEITRSFLLLLLGTNYGIELFKLMYYHMDFNNILIKTFLYWYRNERNGRTTTTAKSLSDKIIQHHLTKEIEKFNINGDLQVCVNNSKKEIQRINMLLYFCQSNNEGMVKFLLQNRVDIHVTDDNHYPPVYIACLNNNKKMLSDLLEYGADVNGTDIYRPLSYACQKNNERMVKFLIKKGANVNIVDINFQTPLGYACEAGNEKIVQILLNNGAIVSGNKNIYKNPLIYACKHGKNNCNHNRNKRNRNCNSNCDCNCNNTIIKRLIEMGSDVNGRDFQNTTPLLYACTNNNLVVVQQLIEKGADVNHKNLEDKTPLLYACENKNMAMVELLIKHGATVNVEDTTGKTPLLLACEKNNVKMIRQNKYNEYTPLTFATAMVRISKTIMNVLLQYGADINKKNSRGNTPLMYACSKNDEEKLFFLLKKGASVTTEKNIQGHTSLTYACDHNNAVMVKVLLNHQENRLWVSNKTIHWTPLIQACKKGNIEIMKLLIDQGMDINEKNKNGDTALTIACKYEIEGLGETPIRIALERKNTKICHYLIEKSKKNIENDLHDTDIEMNTNLQTSIDNGYRCKRRRLLI